MVGLETGINTALDVFFRHDLTTELGGTISAIDQFTLYGFPPLFPLHPPNPVSSTVFQTILLEKFGLESVGIINVGDMGVAILTDHSASTVNGEIKFEISGDGGITWTTPPIFQKVVLPYLDQAWQYIDIGTVYTDETGNCSSNIPDSIPFFTVAPAADDAFYFGYQLPFDDMTVNVSTAGIYVATIVWEYWNGATWATLTVTDGTSGFTVAGINNVTFAIPNDWAATAVNGVTEYYIRIRITTLTTQTTQPLGQQVTIIGGYAQAVGLGTWLKTIKVGDDMLQFRLSARTISPGPGVFATSLDSRSHVEFMYRKSAI
jgi:hypothetical protein